MTNLFAIWQFTSLAMLGWAGAALAPILIHLFTRKRFRKVTWAAMEYLLAAAKKNQRRIQVEQWLLLAVRTALLLILALALADPLLSRTHLPTLGHGVLPTHRVYVIDASYSMDLRSDGVPRFEAAKQAVREHVASAAQGDGFSLVMLGDPPRVIIGEPAFSKSDLLEELNAATLSHGLGDFAATLDEVESLLATARKQHARLAATEVIFLADLERTTWEPAASPEAAARLKKLATQASLALVDLGVDELRNTAVVRAEVRESPVTIDREFTIEAEVAAFGEGARGERLATLLVDQEAVGQQAVQLDASGRGSLAFRHRFASPGDHAVEIRLADDPLHVDNHRWVSVPVREALKVLCIYSRPGETRYLALALEPEKTPAVRVRVEEAADTVLLERELADYDALFLVNLPQLDASQAQVLQAYLAGGGGLVFFPGDLLRPKEFLPTTTTESPLLPIEFSALAPTGNYRFTPLDYRHPLIAPFRGFERAGLLSTPVWKYVKLQATPGADVETALSFDSGDPAILVAEVGRGRAIVFATAASPESVDTTTTPPTPWTALPTWPSFPPLVQEALSLAAQGREEGRNRLVGEPLSSLVRAALPDTRLTLTPPAASGRTEATARPLRLESEGELWRWAYGETLLSGLYAVQFGAPLNRVEQFAVNVDPRESALQRIDPALLPAELVSTKPANGSGTAAGATTTANYAWFRPLLLTVIALLALESFLGRWFGGGRN